MKYIGEINGEDIYKHDNKYHTITRVPISETAEQLLNPNGKIFNEIENIDILNKIKILLDTDYHKIIIKEALGKFRIVAKNKYKIVVMANYDKYKVRFTDYYIQVKWLFWWITIRTFSDNNDPYKRREARYNQVVEYYNNIIKDYDK